MSTTTTPAWLLEREVGLCPCGCIGRRRKTGFVDKTISGGTAVLGRALFADDAAGEPGLLQRLDTRVALLAMLGLLLVASLVRHLPVLLALYALTLALAAASRLSLGFFVKRVWLFVPIFTGIVALPATLNVVTPGHVIVPLGTWFGTQLGITEQGLMTASLLVARVAVSISVVVLLTLTSRWNDLLAAMRGLRVPRAFVMIIGIAYRYLFLLLRTVEDMYTARKARTVLRRRDTRSGRAFVAASAGTLFAKSHALAEDVYQAMVARGYRGDARAMEAPRFRPTDGLAIVGLVVIALTTLGVDHVL